MYCVSLCQINGFIYSVRSQVICHGQEYRLFSDFICNFFFFGEFFLNFFISIILWDQSWDKWKQPAPIWPSLCESTKYRDTIVIIIIICWKCKFVWISNRIPNWAELRSLILVEQGLLIATPENCEYYLSHK